MACGQPSARGLAGPGTRVPRLVGSRRQGRVKRPGWETSSEGFKPENSVGLGLHVRDRLRASHGCPARPSGGLSDGEDVALGTLFPSPAGEDTCQPSPAGSQTPVQGRGVVHTRAFLYFSRLRGTGYLLTAEQSQVDGRL